MAAMTSHENALRPLGADSMESEDEDSEKRSHTCKNSQKSNRNKDSPNEHSQVASTEKEPFYKFLELKKHSKNKRPSDCDHKPLSPEAEWKKRLHFTSLPVYKFGNWIPYAIMHWPCFGNGCALAQVVVKSTEEGMGSLFSFPRSEDGRREFDL